MVPLPQNHSDRREYGRKAANASLYYSSFLRGMSLFIACHAIVVYPIVCLLNKSSEIKCGQG